MTRRVADIALAVAVVAAVVYVPMVWTTGEWRDTPFWAMMWRRMLPPVLTALQMVGVAVMAHAAVRALTTGGGSMRLVWVAFAVAAGSMITSRLQFYFLYGDLADLDWIFPVAVLDIAMAVAVFMLARLVILRAGPPAP